MYDIDMSKYRPYRRVRNNSLTRPIREKKIIWPRYKKFFSEGKICFRLLENKDVQVVSELWRECYGELYGSPIIESWVLYPELYKDCVLFGDTPDWNSNQKDFIMIIFENVDDHQIWGAWVFWKDDNNLQIDFGFGFIHPDFRQNHRDNNFEIYLQDFLNTLENDSGAEYFTVTCETFHNISQFLVFKKWGFKLGGIFPGETTRWSGEQNEYRACIIHFYKFKKDVEKFVSPPSDWVLLPEFQRVWNILDEINK